MKKIISTIIAISMICTATVAVSAYETEKEYINPFVDVPEDAWYHDEVVEAVGTGIINGKTTTEFKPDDYLTYAEAIKLAACMNQLYTNGVVTLKSGDPWYMPYVEYCEENEIISKEYEFSEKATRAGYMEIFADSLPSEAYSEINTIPDGSIKDVKDDSPYSAAVYKLYRAGIVTGVDDKHNCNPDANIKRCEVATIISRMMNEKNRQKFDMHEEKLENKGEIDDVGDINNTIKVENNITEPDESVKKDTTDKPQETDGYPIVVDPENPEVTVKVPTQTIVTETDVPVVEVEGGELLLQDTPLTVYKQPESYEAEEYGKNYEFEVVVFGGKAPYTYEWLYYTGNRNDTDKLTDGDYVKFVEDNKLSVSVEKENTLLGKKIYCQITDSEGTKVKTDMVKIYGPFSMNVEDWTLESDKNTLIGRVADGVLKKGEKVSVIRNNKVIAIGVAEDLQMFNKSMDEAVKGENIGIIFADRDGALPSTGDIVVKYQETHELDLSEIVN